MLRFRKGKAGSQFAFFPQGQTNPDLLRSAEREEVLRALDGILEPAKELLEIGAAFHEVDVGGVDHQEVRGGVVKEKVLVSARNLFDIFEGNLSFIAGGLLGDACAKHLGLGLEVDDQIRCGNPGGKRFIVTVVKLQLFVIEIEIGENAIFLHEEVGEDGSGCFDGKGVAQAILAINEEVHLGTKGGPGFFLVEIGQKGIVFAIVNASGVQAFGKHFRQGRFAYAKGTFDDDETWRLWTALWNRGAFGGRGFVGGHFVGSLT
jgi:hypothetical protein